MATPGYIRSPSFPVSPHRLGPPSTGPLPGPAPPHFPGPDWPPASLCEDWMQAKEGPTVLRFNFSFLDLNYKCCKEMEDQCIECIKILKEIDILKIHEKNNLIPNLLVIDFT